MLVIADAGLPIPPGVERIDVNEIRQLAPDAASALIDIPAGPTVWNGSRTMTDSMLRRPSALLPLLMSCAALAIVLVHIAVAGVARQPDEGAEAHLWQLLMAGQLPIIAFFAVTSLPRRPRPAIVVLTLQAVAALA